jgi:formylglycine-generating enzyme required for sulfatase activity/serine/threonine protein kinase
MPKAPACPEVTQYQQLALGKLPLPEKEALLIHLEGCDSCARRVEGLTEKDTLIDLIRQGRTLAEGSGGQTVARLVEQLRQLKPAPSSIAFTCPACSKGLKVKAGLAGKKVKCPQCQAVVPVPAAAATEPRSLTDVPTLAPGAPAGATQELPSPYPKELCDFLAPAQAPDELGRLGTYRILRVLGAGGMGVVFKAEDPGLQRLVALKAMLPGLAASGSAKQRFLREARSAAGLKHDHIVTIHQVGEDRGAPFLAMEFLEGEPLDERLKRQGKLPVGEILRIGREMAEGLAAAHERGLTHRDIKPANVWLEGKKGRVKILDFGLARASTDESNLTQSGAIVGTPAYMAPEQAQCKAVGPSADLFSLGCVLYRMATGEPPFKGGDMISTLMAVATENPTPPHELDAALPAKLSELIMRLLAKDATGRPASAQAVSETLHKIEEQVSRSGLPSRTKPVSGPAQPVRPTGKGSARHAGPTVAQPPRKRLPLPWLIGAGALGVGVLVAAIILFWQTPHGTVRIQSDDPNVEIMFDKTGPTIKGAGSEPISLRAGEHGILIKRGDFTFGTDKLLIEKGKTITLKIEVLPGKIQLVQDGQVIAAGDMPLPKEFSNSLGMEFVLVPKGKSWLGGGRGRPGTQEVEVLQDFYLGKYEVTQEEWERVTGINPSFFKEAPGGTKRFPVEQVSWDDCQIFVHRLNDKAKETGWLYRLPTGVEWEYACRGGPMKDKFEGAFDFYVGKATNTMLPGQANFEHGKGLRRTCNVGSYKPNRLGLFDMHGNVWELCQDEKIVDGISVRRVRGGSWANGLCPAGVDIVTALPKHLSNDLGVRVARVPVGKEIVKIAPDKTKTETPPAFTNRLGMEFVQVPKGKSWLGGGGGRPGTQEVEMLHDFYLGKYEVTQEEWEKVMGTNPSTFKAVPGVSKEDQKRFPVEFVSWEDAQLFLKELNRRDKETGWVYRLPREAEWEYACRGGPANDKSATAFDFYFEEPTNQLSPAQANFDHGKGLKRTCKVGSYKPNRLGLYDMHGNVWEWCEEPYAEGPNRVYRGGGWGGPAPAVARGGRDPGVRDFSIGFRLARVPIGQEIVKLAPAGPEPATKPDRDRREAEWVLSLGGGVSVHVNGVDRDVRAGGKLPTEAFELRRVDLSPNLPGGSNPVVNRALKDDDGLSHLAGLTNLVRIDLWNTTVTDAGLAHLKGLTTLRELYLFGCPHVSDAGVAHLKDLTNLRALDLNGARVTDAGLVHLKGLQNLKSLNLMATRVSGAGLVHLKGLTGLENVALAGSQVDDKGLAHVEGLSNLGWLSLNGTRVTDAGLVHLEGLTRLASIHLSGPSVSAAGLVHLKRLPNLRGINLSGAHVNDAWLKQLHGLSTLRILELPDTKVTAQGIAAFKKALPECRVHVPSKALTNSFGMGFVQVPRGTFYMGGGGGKPGRKTEVKEDFEMGVHLVTQGQWRDVMGAPLKPESWFSRTGTYSDRVVDISDDDLKQFPVDNVSWHDAQAFIKEINSKERDKGYLYRLPTEAEWEYACRGGASSPEECSYHFYAGKPSNDLSSREANFNGDNPAGKAARGPNLQRTTKVGSYPANKLGLYDMHGNLWQWCQDAFAETDAGKVIRGGGYGSSGLECRAGLRGRGVSADKQNYCGFRVVRVRVGNAPSAAVTPFDEKQAKPTRIGFRVVHSVDLARVAIGQDSK